MIGGLDDWLTVADRVIAMESYVPRDITAEAKAIVQKFPSQVFQDTHYGSLAARNLVPDLHGKRSPYAMRKVSRAVMCAKKARHRAYMTVRASLVS